MESYQTHRAARRAPSAGGEAAPAPLQRRRSAESASSILRGLGVCAFLVAVTLGLALGCGDSTSARKVEVYQYEGCGDSDGCPGEAAFTCAMKAIATRHNSCTRRSDCAVADGPEPESCVSFCSWAAVRRDQQEDYVREAATEVHRFCTLSSCHAYLHCPRPERAVADCVDGRCTLVEGEWRLPDAGTRDGS